MKPANRSVIPSLIVDVGTETGSAQVDAEFADQLQQCVVAGKSALARSQRASKRLREVLRVHSERVQAVPLPESSVDDRQLQKLHDEFRQQIDDLKVELRQLASRFESDLNASLKGLNESASYVTIALFGRSKTGKSITMEALTRGSGRTRGVGRQNTTREITPYFWPPGQKTLRVVDTPGIEAFRGDELAVMAQEYVERADLILFLVSDDKASAEELDQLGKIRTMGKSVIVLLNVKEGDVDLLLEAPDYVFDPAQLDGHARRISGYLSHNFGFAEPEVLPLHALAGWQSTQEKNPKKASALRRASRLATVEKRLESFVRTEGRAARLRSPRDCLTSYVVSAKNQLRPYAGMFRALHDSAAEQQERILERVERQLKTEKRRLPAIRNPFDEASACLPDFVDGLIARGEGGAKLNRAWGGFLEQHELDQVELNFKRGVSERLGEEISEQLTERGFDAAAKLKADNISHLFDAANASKKNEAPKMFVRAGIRTAGGVGVAALATWAVANFWNPTGWLAGGAALLVVAGSGVAGGEGAKMATDAWLESDRKALARERSKIIAKLERELSRYSDQVERSCTEWLKRMPAAVRDGLRHSFGFIEKGARSVWQVTVRTLHELDDAATELDDEWLIHCVDLVAKEHSLEVEVIGAAHCDELGVKLAVSGLHELPDGPWLDHLTRLLNSDVALIDADAPPKERVAAALDPAEVPISAVRIKVSNGGRDSRAHPRSARNVTATVELDAAQSKLAIGPGGSNVRAAQRLLGIRIRIVGPKEQESRR